MSKTIPYMMLRMIVKGAGVRAGIKLANSLGIGGAGKGAIIVASLLSTYILDDKIATAQWKSEISDLEKLVKKRDMLITKSKDKILSMSEERQMTKLTEKMINSGNKIYNQVHKSQRITNFMSGDISENSIRMIDTLTPVQRKQTEAFLQSAMEGTLTFLEVKK